MSPGVRRARERAIEVRGARIPGSGGWRPYLLTLAALTLVWMALWGSAGLIVILLGIAVGALVLLLFPLPFMQFRFGLHPWRMLVLLLRFLWDVVVASLQVGWLALRPRPPQTGGDRGAADHRLRPAAVADRAGGLAGARQPDRRSRPGGRGPCSSTCWTRERRPMTQFADQVRAQERRIQLALGDDSVTSDVAGRRRRDAGRRTDRGPRSAGRAPEAVAADDAHGDHRRAACSRSARRSRRFGW